MVDRVRYRRLEKLSSGRGIGKPVGKRFSRILTRLVIGLSAVEKPWRRVDTRLRVAEGLLSHQRVETQYGPLRACQEINAQSGG
jgi:hypothetical protein